MDWLSKYSDDVSKAQKGKTFKKTVSESTSVGRDRIPISSKDVVTKIPGTNVHTNHKGEFVVKDDTGVYKPIKRNQATLSQGKKKSSEEYAKEQEIIKEMQSNDLGLRAPLQYLANPDQMLGDFGNLTGFKPLQNFANSDEDAKRYNFQALDPSKTQSQRYADNFSEGLSLVPSAALNLGLASMATRGNIQALKEAYNPIPLPFVTSPKYNVEDQFKYVENQSDSVNLMDSTNVIPTHSTKKEIKKFVRNNILTDKLFNRLESVNSFLNPERFVRRLDPFHYNQTKKDLQKANDWMENWYNSPETSKKIDEFYGDGWENRVLRENIDNKNYKVEFENPINKLDNFVTGESRTHKNNNGVSGYYLDRYKSFGKRQNLADRFSDPNRLSSVAVHEGNHGLTDGNTLIYNRQHILQEPFNTENYTPRLANGDYAKESDYYLDPTEIYARIDQIRHDYNFKPGKNVSQEEVNKIINDGLNEKNHVNKDFFKLISSPEKFKELLNILPAAAIGTGAATQLPEYQKGGGIVKDNNGYWNPDNWGKPVEIDGNNITMEGVHEPLLGISDTGDTKLMHPGKNYKFKGKKVTEFPLAKNGINNLNTNPLQKLEDLTNFTNYNQDKKEWLTKYQ